MRRYPLAAAMVWRVADGGMDYCYRYVVSVKQCFIILKLRLSPWWRLIFFYCSRLGTKKDPRGNEKGRLFWPSVRNRVFAILRFFRYKKKNVFFWFLVFFGFCSPTWVLKYPMGVQQDFVKKKKDQKKKSQFSRFLMVWWIVSNETQRGRMASRRESFRC